MSADATPVSGPQCVLAVCADDFGLTPAISRGIAQLAQLGRLTAISCLTNGQHWPGSAPMLTDLPIGVDRGLHFNLTEGVPLSEELRRRWPRLPALHGLILRAHLGRLPLREIACEWRAQFRAFSEQVGAPPRFVDGHQHVHHLPGIREVVLEHVTAGPAGVAVRNTGHMLGPGNSLKRCLIERTGGRQLQRLLLAAGIAHNRALLGAYDFKEQDYRGRMQRWLAAAPSHGGLLFCHPAASAVASSDADANDPIVPARLREAAYLGSTPFVEDLAAAGIGLGRAWLTTQSV